MPAVDWILLGVLVFSTILGAWRGLVYEVLSLLAWIAAFFAAQWFAPQVAAWLPITSAPDSVQYAAAFLVVFIAAVFAVGLLAYLVKKLVESVGLRPIDRILGAGFGLVRGVVLLLAATVVMDLTSLKTSDWWMTSQGAQVLDAALQGIKPLLPEQFAKFLA